MRLGSSTQALPNRATASAYFLERRAFLPQSKRVFAAAASPAIAYRATTARMRRKPQTDRSGRFIITLPDRCRGIYVPGGEGVNGTDREDGDPL